MQTMLVEVKDLIAQAVLPILTVVPSWKPAPVTVNKTPAVEPTVGEMLVIVGVTEIALVSGSTNSAFPFPTTLTTRVEASFGVISLGTVTVMEVAELAVTVQSTPLIVTVGAEPAGVLSSPVPVISREPPAATVVKSRAVICGVRAVE